MEQGGVENALHVGLTIMDRSQEQDIHVPE